VAYAEKRGNLWRARWRAPAGTLESKTGFKTRKAAEDYGRDKEAEIRSNTYVDPRAGRITLTTWVNQWYPALDLELTTLSNYRYLIEVHILPDFGERTLMSLTPVEIAIWEKTIVTRGFTRRTARDARSTLTTILADAIPRYIQTNPAARRSGKGRKGQRRIERAEKKEKVWATPLETLLIAERAAALSGMETDFVMILTVAYTGMRWGEIIGLPPDCIHEDTIDIHWKLYELDGRFYRGRPKDGSMRTVDLPLFLRSLLVKHMKANPNSKCTCRNPEKPYCPGDEYVFLGPKLGHFRRSNYSERVIRPAADGWYPKKEGKNPRPSMPVLVDLRHQWPGRPLPPWPAASGEPFTPPQGRGRPRLAEESAVASWRPVLTGLTPHGLRHGHQTWMDEAGTSYVLQSERMGHEVPGMRGVYGHVSPGMRADLVAALEGLWECSLQARAELAPRSSVPILDALLRARRGR
jgi:integrase